MIDNDDTVGNMSIYMLIHYSQQRCVNTSGRYVQTADARTHAHGGQMNGSWTIQLSNISHRLVLFTVTQTRTNTVTQRAL